VVLVQRRTGGGYIGGSCTARHWRRLHWWFLYSDALEEITLVVLVQRRTGGGYIVGSFVDVEGWLK